MDIHWPPKYRITSGFLDSGLRQLPSNRGSPRRPLVSISQQLLTSHRSGFAPTIKRSSELLINNNRQKRSQESSAISSTSPLSLQKSLSRISLVIRKLISQQNLSHGALLFLCNGPSFIGLQLFNENFMNKKQSKLMPKRVAKSLRQIIKHV